MTDMRRRVVFTVAVALAAVLSSTAHAQSEDATAKQFVGLWRQVSRTQRFADGTTRQHPSSVANVIYTDTGHMWYVAMNPNRPQWKSATAPTDSEMKSTIGNEGFYAYCATVEIHAREGFVFHHVVIDKVPNSVGISRKRWFTFQGPNRLSLRIDTPELTSPIVEDTLVWERVQK